MGCWSKEIIGSDEALDFLSDIKNICLLGEEDDITKDILEKYQLDIFNHWKLTNPSIISFQTLSAIIVQEGAIFQKEVLEKCIYCLEQDEWSKISLERKYHVDYLLNVLRNYNNIPTSYYDAKINFGLKNKDNIEYIISILKNIVPNYFLNLKVCFIGSYKYGILITLGEDTPDNFFEHALDDYFDIPVVYTK